MRFYLPTCARCGKDVEKMYMFDDQLSAEQVFFVECHGDIEETRLTHQALAGCYAIEKGVAFRRDVVDYAENVLK